MAGTIVALNLGLNPNAEIGAQLLSGVAIRVWRYSTHGATVTHFGLTVSLLTRAPTCSCWQIDMSMLYRNPCFLVICSHRVYQRQSTPTMQMDQNAIDVAELVLTKYNSNMTCHCLFRNVNLWYMWKQQWCKGCKASVADCCTVLFSRRWQGAKQNLFPPINESMTTNVTYGTSLPTVVHHTYKKLWALHE